ncbi:recombinase family protein [Helcobacillus massiliensis]|uniref:DNA invertase Pin-like site-specific DNA recombinase n=1 Tax=Helcobacillus massiliensis TaxID=521392 RepID=A0A839QZM2_9MICO|nr:recombinase family protein [Helcobacillus massiliensis]MBB3022847.1 DNA invertase Pin-like site-specific DNA recombinase [Helcobacillus massiliensis]
MNTMIGYARVSTDSQDLRSQRQQLQTLGVMPEHIYFDEGLTGTTRVRPGLVAALKALRSGDVFVVTKLDRLGRSARDLGGIADELTTRGITLSLGGKPYDPSDPMDKMFFGMLGLFAEFERDLISARTREALASPERRVKMTGRKPKLTPAQRRQVIRLHTEGEHSAREIGELFGVSRQTIYRVIADEAALEAPTQTD